MGADTEWAVVGVLAAAVVGTLVARARRPRRARTERQNLAAVCANPKESEPH